MERGIDHDYIVRPGVHDGLYWNNSIDYQWLFFKNSSTGDANPPPVRNTIKPAPRLPAGEKTKHSPVRADENRTGRGIFISEEKSSIAQPFQILRLVQAARDGIRDNLPAKVGQRDGVGRNSSFKDSVRLRYRPRSGKSPNTLRRGLPPCCRNGRSSSRTYYTTPPRTGRRCETFGSRPDSASGPPPDICVHSHVVLSISTNRTVGDRIQPF